VISKPVNFLTVSVVPNQRDFTAGTAGPQTNDQVYRGKYDAVDFPFLTQVYADCLDCQDAPSLGFIPTQIGGSYPPLYLIDCESLTINQMNWDTPFAALSYVWGSQGITPSEATSESLTLPLVLPLTISDALVATQKFSLKYLWVDRYCIDSRDSIKHHQIAAMDRVYTRAKVTIVAVAGDNSDAGLPGVTQNRPSTSCREYVRIGKLRFSALPTFDCFAHV
jgi:hypothetical protein